MSKPFSVRTEPWTSFDKQSYSIFSDDFVHEKLLTVKVNLKTSTGGVNLKQVAERKDTGYKTGGEIKLWFPVWNARNGALYFRSKNNEVKVHYDDGLRSNKLGNFQTYNLYCSYQSQKDFKNVVLKAGANLIAQKHNFDNRVRVGFTEKGETEVSTGHKFCWVRNDWSFDLYDIFCWKTRAWTKNAVRLAYRKDNNDFFLRAENDTTRNFNSFNFTSLDTYFTKFIADYVRKVDDLTKVGIEGEFTKKGFGKATFVVQRSVPQRDIGLKFKISSDKSAAVCFQSVLKNYGKWTAGWQVSDLGKTNKSQYGVQFELNL